MGEVDYESLPTNNLWQHLLAGAMAGLMEHCAVYPVDCVKVSTYVDMLAHLMPNTVTAVPVSVVQSENPSTHYFL